MEEFSDELLSDQVFHQYLGLLGASRRFARQILDERGLKQREFSVLRFLLESGPLTVGQVQVYIHHSPSTTSTLIAQMEHKGYVTRTRSAKDNRVVIVELTDAGREVAENTPLGGSPLLRRRLSTFSTKRLQQIGDVLIELMNLMEDKVES